MMLVVVRRFVAELLMVITCDIRLLAIPFIIIVIRRSHYLSSNKSRVGWLMDFNTTFNNISVISWWSVLFVE
jgi:hypothetical protein